MSNRKAQVHHEAHEDGIHRIVLDRPDARNAISSQVSRRRGRTAQHRRG
jgi:enoyl-CoA hydratase/carnithine racemase